MPLGALTVPPSKHGNPGDADSLCPESWATRMASRHAGPHARQATRTTLPMIVADEVEADWVNAVGARVRRLPLTPQRLMEAIKA